VFTKAIRNQNQMVPLPPCAEWWGETDNRATTPFGYCTSTTFLPVRPPGHIARIVRIPDENVRRSPLTRTPTYCVDEDYPARPEIPKWSNRCAWHRVFNSGDWCLYVWRYALLLVWHTQ